MVKKLFPVFVLAASQAVAAPMPLSPKDVAELILQKSLRAQEINLSAQQNQLTLATATSAFDFNLTAEHGIQNSEFESPTLSYFVEDRSTISTLKLTKPFITGTTLGVEYSNTTSVPTYTSSAPTPSRDSTTSLLGFTVEQDLLQNFFGVADRASIRAAEATVEASKITRINQMQDLVLEGIQAYWSAFVSQETFKNAVNSRDRYAKLVQSVKRKSGYGYTGPGELSQAQAELESREQKVKSESVNYLGNLEKLLTLLQLPPQSEIQFAVAQDIPAPPKTDDVVIENLRPVKASQLAAKAAEEQLTESKSNALPDVSLVGKYYAQGLDESASEAYSEMAGFTYPRYYVGVKLEYGFGSGIQEATVLNRRLGRDLANTQLQRQKLELRDRGQDIQRRIQSTYAIAQSSKTQRSLREKAAQELTRSYTQGRTDIAILIEALNKYYDSEVQLVRAIGDYQIALNQWAAFQDQLILDSGVTKNP